PFAELAVGLLLGRVERRAAWLLVGFPPAAAMAIGTATAAYLDGMWGRPAGRAATADARTGYPGGRSGRVPGPGVAVAGSFARRDPVPR
ncbi:MAG TPA: hypothetical protein VF755_29600, partial [Catenuloplanes sp.]